MLFAFNVCVCVRAWCMCACVCSCLCMWRPGESVRSSGAGEPTLGPLEEETLTAEPFFPSSDHGRNALKGRVSNSLKILVRVQVL